MKRPRWLRRGTGNRQGIPMTALMVKRDDGKTTSRLTPGLAFQWLGRDYWIGKGGELRRYGR